MHRPQRLDQHVNSTAFGNVNGKIRPDSVFVLRLTEIRNIEKAEFFKKKRDTIVNTILFPTTIFIIHRSWHSCFNQAHKPHRTIIETYRKSYFLIRLNTTKAVSA